MDRDAAEQWIRSHVTPTGGIDLIHEQPWATVLRVCVGDTWVWFKECSTVAAFEPRLTAELYARSPETVAEVLAHDDEHGRLLLADAGTAIGAYGNPPEAWETLLPHYAELQRRETPQAADHVAHGVPDLRTETLPARYEEMLARDFPLEPDEIDRLRRFTPRFAELCADLASRGIADTVQHDDLHFANVYEKDGRMLVLDWGDSCVAHPFASLVVTFEHLFDFPMGDPWFARLRDAYLEPWGADVRDTFELAFRIGSIAHVIAWFRQHDHLPEDVRSEFMERFADVIRRALAYTEESAATYW